VFVFHIYLFIYYFIQEQGAEEELGNNSTLDKTEWKELHDL